MSIPTTFPSKEKTSEPRRQAKVSFVRPQGDHQAEAAQPQGLPNQQQAQQARNLAQEQRDLRRAVDEMNRQAAQQAQPVILEPIMAVEVTTPEDYMGDVIGDLNSRRGQIQAMEQRAGARVAKGLVPLSEMFGYVGDLRSKTQGRASYSMQFDSYAEVPRNVAEEIVKKARGE